MATVSLRDVRKSYGGTEVIHGVSIDIADGEFIVIVGPSGCGKSTLLRMVAGLEPITSGTIEIGGRVVNDLEPRARDIAMVFQNYALYPHMSVFDNMAYGLKIAGIRGADLKARVEATAAMLELTPYLRRKPRELSGGQRQRVAMGRALVRGPAAFLLDEPLSNLDAKLRVQMRLQIKALQREVGTTALYVTHDQVEAMTLADRLIVMNAGRRRADRHAARGLRAPGHGLRRRLHRLAGDEHPARHDPGRHGDASDRHSARPGLRPRRDAGPHRHPP